MNEIIYRGIIIKQSNYGDAHRMLWIYTKNSGIIKAVRYGVRGKKAANAASFQLFCYGDFKLRPSNGDVMTAVSADIIDGFYPISEDIIKVSLITYFCDLTHWVLGENNKDDRIMSLLLNIIYAAAYRDEPYLKLKAVYELKLMSAAGFMINFEGCHECGDKAQFISLENGVFSCREHRLRGDIKISYPLFLFMRFITMVEDKKMLSFDVLNESSLIELNEVTEAYVRVQCDREFDSLKYFKSML